MTGVVAVGAWAGLSLWGRGALTEAQLEVEAERLCGSA